MRNKIEQVAIYARISKKDTMGISSKESQSISNQIALAQEFIAGDSQLSKMQVQIFRDEGYTGTNMERPAVQKLLANIYLGKIQALVLKDFSRLSRNHLQLSDFRENIIGRYPIILIAIGEGYDNRNTQKAELCLGIKSIFYEYYCRDISRKAKQSIAAKKQEGNYAVARAPYGYKRGIDGRFQIKSGEANNIRKIFQLAEKGWNVAQIAREISVKSLEEETENHQKKWTSSQIWRIINNPVYTGCQVWHKYESRYDDGFSMKEVERTLWKKKEEMHPAIISRQQYEKVQSFQKRTASFEKRKGKRHMFQGITKCVYCKKALCRHRRKKNYLCCREKHMSKEILIPENQLWEICRQVWKKQRGMVRDKNLEEISSQQEKRLFIKYMIERIEVGEKRLLIRWKTTAMSGIIEEITNDISLIERSDSYEERNIK